MAIGHDPNDVDVSEFDRMIRETFKTTTPVGARCTKCGTPLTHPAISWHFSADVPDMWLHPACAFSLAMGLLNDVQRIGGMVELREEMLTETWG